LLVLTNNVIMSVKDNNRRIAKNTLLLYFRMLFTMGVTLYTSRITLNILGVVDYGIYNVVGGVVAMFTVISGSLSASIMRHMTYELGRHEQKKLKDVFSTSIIVQVLLALIVIVVGELVGVWFLNVKMNIPSERLVAANWVLQCSIFTFAVNLISIPYNAVIIAHEKMGAFAYISIIEVCLKLVAVYLLYVLFYDKLVLWAILLLIISLIIRLIYVIYCKCKFEECRFSFLYNKSLVRQMMSFAGWNLIGSTSFVLKDQGINIVLNLFCGAAVNAARGIAFQVNTAINNFVTNFMTAINPQITKSYASGDMEYMNSLIERGSRFSFYMLLILSLPIMIETPYILKLWLNIVPEHTVNFVRLVLLTTLIDSISGPLMTSAQATGRIRNYQLMVGGITLLAFPISYVWLRLGGKPEITMIIVMCISICTLFVRLRLLEKMINLNIALFTKNVLVNVSLVFIISTIIPIILHYILEGGFIRLLIIIVVSVPFTFLVIFWKGCKREEQKFIVDKIAGLYNKYR